MTLDVPQRMQSLRTLGLKVPPVEHAIYQDMQEGLVRWLSEFLPRVDLKLIPMEELAANILAETRRYDRDALMDSAVIVSTCHEIAAGAHGYIIEVNRILNSEGEIIGIGPRPGAVDLEEQVMGIARAAAGRPIIIMEDGIFTGRTLVHLVKLFQAEEANVAAVVTGFSFPQGRKALSTIFKGKIIEIERPKKVLDWMPDHDFFPLVPNCGRTIGVKMNGACYPFYSPTGVSYSVPYIVNFCPIDRWASLTGDRTRLLAFGRFCVQQMIELYDEIGHLNKRDIVLSDLRSCRPRISIPRRIRQLGFPEISGMKVVDFLNDQLHSVI